MKRTLFVLLAMLALVVPLRGQELIADLPMPVEHVTPKDSLSDLWIVLLDMSGSMKETGKKWKNVFNNKNNKEHVSKIVDSLVSEYGNKTKDVFVLLEFGADTDTLNRLNNDSNYYSDNELVSNVIHERRTDGNDYSSIKEQVEEICNPKQAYLFNYGRSYTSVVRPLSMFVVAKKRKLDFLQYKNIYNLMITDNGDNASDQWSIDYNTTKKIWKKHFDCFKRILPTIASSEFDFTSIKSGKFIELTTLDVPPYYFLSQFVTYQECNPEKELTADTLVMVSDFHNDRFTIQMKPCGDSVNFVYVDICRVNGHPIPVKQYLYLGDSVVVEYDKSYAKTFANEVSIKGSYQEIYKDRVLGLRYRKIEFGKTPEKAELSTTFVLEETKAVGRQYGRLAALLLLAVIIFLLIWREWVVLKIFVNGKCMRIKRKAMNKLRKEDYFLVKVLFDKYGMPDVLFYKGKGISVEDDNQTQKFGKVMKIWSWHELSLDSPAFRSRKKDNFNVIEFDHTFSGRIQFSYSNRLMHNLVISFGKQHGFELKPEENKLRVCNIGMLARYYEEHALEINKLRNNVQVNIIRKEAFKEILGDDYKLDYAILNIFDLNCRNRANHIFLRSSIVCNFNGSQSDADVTKKLLQVAEKNILKSEKQKLGFFATVAYKEKPEDETGVEVDVSPMLTYLYLLKEGEEGKMVKKKKNRIVYSPFIDGRPPFLDGRPSLTSKTVQIYPNSVMTLLNLPVKYKKPAAKKKFGYEESFNPRRKKSETLYFKGADKIRFLDKELSCSKGRLEGGVTNTWSLDSLMF